MDVEKEFAYLLAKEIVKKINCEIGLSSVLGNKYEKFVEVRAKLEESAEEKRWPKRFRFMWKPGSYAEQFDDFDSYCEFCQKNGFELGV